MVLNEYMIIALLAWRGGVISSLSIYNIYGKVWPNVPLNFVQEEKGLVLVES